ncbi:MAG TPA: dihydrolipoamide acetyltransferase family protein [Gemmatimonadaceae bacterium]|nr:dihydrolipoamide acetyltransferase family protein [Gemmatimonadaceae bacterium]
MARIDVLMPSMGESLAEGTLTKWMKKVGDAVKRDETIFEISTDKVDSEVQAVSAGILAEILVKEGETVPVNAVVARLETDVNASVPASTPAPEPAGKRADGQTGRAAEAPAPRAAIATPAPAPQADGRTTSPGLPAIVPGSPPPGSLEERLRTKSSPLVRRMAAEHGVDITSLSGSGISGRVTKKDLTEYLESGANAAPVAPAARLSMYAPAGFDYQPPTVTPWPGDVVEPMSKIRKLTAGHMAYSKQTSAHVTTVFEVDLTRVTRVRDKLRPEFDARGDKLTYLPFIIQAVVEGLRKFPVINAAVRGNDIVFRKHYHIGIAVALDWGLIVPVIRDADNYSLAGLTRSLNDLASRARAKKLKPEEVQDSTFTITNPGVFGSIMGTPVIPQPTVAILGTGMIEKRPKVVKGPEGEDLIAIRTCAHFFLSFDHRVVDGADADRFLGFVKQQLEAIPEPGN